MDSQVHATGGRTVGPDPRSAVTAELLDVLAVGSLLNCSARHVYRLANTGNPNQPAMDTAWLELSRIQLRKIFEESCTPAGGRLGGWDKLPQSDNGL